MDQVLAFQIEALVDQEVLLFRPDGGHHPFHFCLAEELENPQSLSVDNLQGAKQRCFLIQNLAAVGTEGGGDAQGVFLDEGIA
ncbi:hypothetical protein DSECCO2_661060 [anaerobic digester metagenome]